MKDVAPNANRPTAEVLKKFVLWVDGAGGALVLLGDQVTIGGVRHDDNRSDVCLLSNLARKHITIHREHGCYHLEAHQPVTFQGQPFPTDPNEKVPLENNTTWRMGDGVEIRFQLPTVLSLTAILEFQSSHRPLIGQPPVAVDQVILMDQNCLIGPGKSQHIPLKNCEVGVILYRSKQQLWCKSKTPFAKNDEAPKTSASLESEDIITGRDYRFRLEALKE